MSRAARLALIAGVVVVAVVLFIVLKPDDKSSSSSSNTAGQTATTKGGKPAKPAIPNIVVKNAKPVGGVRNLTYNKGDTVQFKVTSDVADEVHVHGYDLHKDVKPGHPVSFKFKANIDGEFEAELESRKEQIVSLRVNP
jgi:pullulanase/glycogen debranching enzyme